MNNKQRKRQRDIKTKLMAAICMLLVSSIMMVSTTYAWFTLSTAPEVTGINTAVGANGNLEMALIPTTQDLTKLDHPQEGIQSGVGDSMEVKSVQDSNVTWGNLVDLGDSTVYGLDKITLNPSRLNVSNGIIGASPLGRPAYGYDGRVTEIKNDTLLGTYNTQADVKGFQQNTYFGVRAIGTSSSMTDRELAYRDAMSVASVATGDARTAASNALNTNGKALANIVIKNVTTDNATFNDTDIAVMLNILNAMGGAYSNIEIAMKQYILANSIANVTDAAFADIKSAIEDATLEELVTSTVTGAVLPDGTATYYQKLVDSKAAVASAKSGLDTLVADTEKTTYVWSDFSIHLSKLVDPNNMKMNDFAVKDLMVKDDNGQYTNISAVLAAAFSSGIQLVMETGSGVFADIADFATDYQADIQIDPFTYSGILTPELPAKMKTKTTVGTTYLAAMRAAVVDFQASEGGTVTKSITDFYGYVIDLAFRTNAADTYLLLQSEAIDRIYSENTANEDTMGGGTYMSFTSADTSFQSADVANLMECIRIVIFDPSTNKVIGYAKLDSENAKVDGSTVKMNLVMCDAAGVEIADDDSTDDLDESIVITKLEQNKAKAISVLVYLDGDKVTNADVANAAQSMKGSMNLQFASSAKLEPMNLADVRNGDDNDTDNSGNIVSSNTQQGGGEAQNP